MWLTCSIAASESVMMFVNLDCNNVGLFFVCLFNYVKRKHTKKMRKQKCFKKNQKQNNTKNPEIPLSGSGQCECNFSRSEGKMAFGFSFIFLTTTAHKKKRKKYSENKMYETLAIWTQKLPWHSLHVAGCGISRIYCLFPNALMNPCGGW